jgi:hypothetical protein
MEPIVKGCPLLLEPLRGKYDVAWLRVGDDIRET